MSNFTYAQYQDTIAKAQAGSTANNVKVGFFKLKNDKDEALVRINVSTMEDLQFATVHQLGAAQKWMKISCHNPVGSYGDNCPLCSAVAAGNTSIGKASKKVYIQMLVSYKDKTTGQWSTPIPVVWDKPAGFAREIATKLQNFGDLKQNLFKITRNGKAGDLKTTYPMDYAVPAIFKPEMIPADFSAFENFKVNKHSYWEKSLEEIQTFLSTGAFPEVVKATDQTVATQAAPQAYQQPQQAAPSAASTYIQPSGQTSSAQPQQPKPDAFSGFSF